MFYSKNILNELLSHRLKIEYLFYKNVRLKQSHRNENERKISQM